MLGSKLAKFSYISLKIGLLVTTPQETYGIQFHSEVQGRLLKFCLRTGTLIKREIRF